MTLTQIGQFLPNERSITHSYRRKFDLSDGHTPSLNAPAGKVADESVGYYRTAHITSKKTEHGKVGTRKDE